PVCDKNNPLRHNGKMRNGAIRTEMLTPDAAEKRQRANIPPAGTLGRNAMTEAQHRRRRAVTAANPAGVHAVYAAHQ
ncbi:hypothetical protein LJC23_05905, partial [Desulfovibrio sp. OttesenSCG-928-I05]|nr:hypothetical protein [Desulfovibrio sp. OttesenSCG-928-I05]